MRQTWREQVEVEELFDNVPFILNDPHAGENRFRAIGQNNVGRFLYVIFMYRNLNLQIYVRPISARYMHQKEIEKYEKAKAI